MENNTTDLTYKQVITYALLTEMILIAFQFAYLKIYVSSINIGVDFAFSTDYMKGAGFYIFQIVGFFAVVVLSFFVFKKSQNQLFNKGMVLFITGGAVELLFYILIHAPYEGAFLFSILDKFIAIAFGAITYYSVSTPSEKPKMP